MDAEIDEIHENTTWQEFGGAGGGSQLNQFMLL